MDDEVTGNTEARLDAYEVLRAVEGKTPHENCLATLWEATLQYGLAIEHMATELRDRAIQERKALRQAIVHRHQAIHGANAKIQTSKSVLCCSARLEGLELYWASIWYQRGDKKPRYNRIKRAVAAGVNLREILKGAHPEEVELITHHEQDAREIRTLWKEHIANRRWFRNAIIRAIKKRTQQQA